MGLKHVDRFYFAAFQQGDESTRFGRNTLEVFFDIELFLFGNHGREEISSSNPRKVSNLLPFEIRQGFIWRVLLDQPRVPRPDLWRNQPYVGAASEEIDGGGSAAWRILPASSRPKDWPAIGIAWDCGWFLRGVVNAEPVSDRVSMLFRFKQ
jgi:hypothetical protein